MEETSISPLDRGHIEADLNFVLDGDVVATASDPNPDLDYGEFLVWNPVVDHPEATVLWDTGSHPDAGEGYWPARCTRRSRTSTPTSGTWRRRSRRRATPSRTSTPW